MTSLLLHSAEDPSQTVVLRTAFAKSMAQKFQSFRKLLVEVIIDDDVFGLVNNRKPGPRAFSFPRSADKISAFIEWLEEQIKGEILQTGQNRFVGTSVDRAWTNFFIQDAYKKGLTKARSQLRGVAPSLARTGGVAGALTNPLHLDRLGYLFTRVFRDLKGITDAMDLQISRVLAQGIADGLSPTAIARQLNQVITGMGSDLAITDTLGRHIPAQKRAEMLARTEIIRAYAEAQLQEFANWGVQGVSVKAEILTTKDNRTCSKCSHLEKTVLTIEEARGVIPIHPLCRCIWVPFFEK